MKIQTKIKSSGEKYMKPLLTVVIPVYNVEKYLNRCLESILIQEWKNYDIILVDDGSTDRSPQICDDYVKIYDFISVIHKENGGLSEARNTGISQAKGEYVYFPDSDDWIEPDTFIALAEALESQKFDIISFNREFVKGEEDVIISDPVETQVFEGKDAFVEMLKHSYITGFANDKVYRNPYSLIITFSFQLVNTMRILEPITSFFFQQRRFMRQIRSTITT